MYISILHIQINFARDLVTYSLIPFKYTNQIRPNPTNSLVDFEEKNDSPDTDDVPSSSTATDENAPGTSDNSNFQAKLSDHAMASVIAEMITTTEEITVKTPKKINTDDGSLKSSEHRQFLDLSDNSFYLEIASYDAKPLAGKMVNFIIYNVYHRACL